MFKPGKYKAISINNIQTLLVMDKFKDLANEFWQKRNGGKTAEESNKAGDNITPINAVILMADFAQSLHNINEPALHQKIFNVLHPLDLCSSAEDAVIAQRILTAIRPYVANNGLRNSVLWFAQQMEDKLKKNDHKHGWEEEGLQYLSMRLTQERKELTEAFKSEDKDRVIKECADIANFCMMIADNFNKNLY